MRKFLFTALCAFSAMTLAAQNFNGLSVSTGNMYPDGSNYGVVLQNELIQVQQLDTTVKYDVVYEFKNNTSTFATVTAALPVNVYFNEFAPGKRSEMLDKLASISTFSDIFAVQDKSQDIREQIRNNFQGRKFVRKYVSADNLKAVGIHVDLFRNNTRINIKKIFCEIKFTDATPLYLPKNTEVLSMEIKFIVEMNFTPDEMTSVMAFLTMPAINAGIGTKETYSMYSLGYEKNWSGRLEALYIKNDIFNATPIMPTKFSEYTTYIDGDRNQVLKYEDIMLMDKDKMAFYNINNAASCTTGTSYTEQLFIPSAIKNITASSWVKTDQEYAKRAFKQTPMIAFSDSLHPYQTGNPTVIDALHSSSMKAKLYDQSNLYNFIAAGCKNNTPSITFKESGNPLYAFDISDHSYEDSTYDGREHLSRQTCWCEGVNGPGVGEYIEFELTQPSHEMHIYNGNQSSKKAFDESSKADIIVVTSLDGHKINPNGDNPSVYRSSIIDLTILNVYELSMPAGKYRITIDAVDKGTVPTTCLSSIGFDFQVMDEWYMRSQSMLRSFFKK